MMSTSKARNASLKASVVWVRSAETKPYMKRSAVRYSTLRSLPIAGPGDRLQQMRLAETHAGVDVERIEHQRIAPAARCHLARRSVRKRIRAADDEAVECQPRIERRAAESFVHRHKRDARARLRTVQTSVVRLARGGGASRALGLTAIGRIAAERTLSSSRVTAGSSDCQVLSTRSL